MNEVRNEEKKEHSMTESVFPNALRALVEGPASSAQWLRTQCALTDVEPLNWNGSIDVNSLTYAITLLEKAKVTAPW